MKEAGFQFLQKYWCASNVSNTKRNKTPFRHCATCRK